MNVEEALEVIDRLKPRRALLTHMSHQMEQEATNANLPPGVELAYDGLRVPLGVFHRNPRQSEPRMDTNERA